jgi:hypothetical protein
MTDEVTGLPTAGPSGMRSISADLPAFIHVEDPPLVFGGEPGRDRGRRHNPLQGLVSYGPHTAHPHGPVLRVATVATHDQQARLFEFLRRLHQSAPPSDRRTYVPDFPGFERAFRVGLEGIPGGACNPTLDHDTPRRGAGDPHSNLVHALLSAIHGLRDHRDQWDVIAILLPSSWDSLRKSPDGRFDLHDRIKATLAPLGVPIQFLREDSALASRQWCSTAWRLSLALFAKAGGVPWRLTPTSSHSTAYVGLHYAIRGGTRNDFVTCCSQVFDAQGGGLEFVAYNLEPRDRGPRRNPHLSRDEMRTVMSRTADVYRKRHAGAMPQRFVVHKESPWRPEEVEGVFDAWGAAESIECVSLRRSRWRGVELASQGARGAGPNPARMPIKRGTLQQFDGHSGLLWTRGPSRVGVNDRYFSPDGKNLPRPISFTRYSGAGDLRLLAADVLALSRLDWNNDSPYNPLPVTLGYAQKLSEVVSNAPDLEDNVYPYRLFL